MDKCFCHFGDYQVKDATARKEIAEVKDRIDTDVTENFNDINADIADLTRRVGTCESINAEQRSAIDNNKTKIQENAAAIEDHTMRLNGFDDLYADLDTYDITALVSFEYESGGDGLNLKTIDGFHALYSPLLKIVFFHFTLSFAGELAEGATLRFRQNKYLPDPAKMPAIQVPIVSGKIVCNMTSTGPTFSPVETVSYAMNTFAGWYFCNAHWE